MPGRATPAMVTPTTFGVSGIGDSKSAVRKPHTREREVFRTTVNYLLKNGSITRTQINDECKERASSGVVLILSNTPLFELMQKPTGLKLRTQKDALDKILNLTGSR